MSKHIFQGASSERGRVQKKGASTSELVQTISSQGSSIADRAAQLKIQVKSLRHELAQSTSTLQRLQAQNHMLAQKNAQHQVLINHIDAQTTQIEKETRNLQDEGKKKEESLFQAVRESKNELLLDFDQCLAKLQQNFENLVHSAKECEGRLSAEWQQNIQ